MAPSYSETAEWLWHEVAVACTILVAYSDLYSCSNCFSSWFTLTMVFLPNRGHHHHHCFETPGFRLPSASPLPDTETRRPKNRFYMFFSLSLFFLNKESKNSEEMVRSFYFLKRRRWGNSLCKQERRNERRTNRHEIGCEARWHPPGCLYHTTQVYLPFLLLRGSCWQMDSLIHLYFKKLVAFECFLISLDCNEQNGK